MKKIKFIERIIKSITDFNFVNVFKKEKITKSIGFMLILYFISVLIVLTVSSATKTSTLESEFDNIIKLLPEFEIVNGETSLKSGETYKEIHLNGDVIIFDLESRHGYKYYNEVFPNNVVLITKSHLLVDEKSRAIELKLLGGSISNDNMDGLTTYFKIGLIIAFFVMSILGVGVLIFISFLVFTSVSLINMVTKNNIKPSDCYKIGIHTMIIPGLLTLIQLSLNFIIPYSLYLYIIIVGFYAFKFIDKYKDESKNIDIFVD